VQQDDDVGTLAERLGVAGLLVAAVASAPGGIAATVLASVRSAL